MWRSLKEHTKAEELMTPYQELAAADKERYDREMEGYVPPSETEIKRKRRRSKDKNRPKRARSSYIFFCAEHRAEAASNLEGKTTKVTAVTTELGRMWRELKKSGDTEKMAKYVQLYEDDKKRFAAESKVYVQENEDNSPKVKTSVPPSRTSVVKEKKVSAKVSTKVSAKKVSTKVSTKVSAKKVSSSKKAGAYRFYVKTTRPDAKKEFPHLSARQLTSALSKRWRELSDEEKQEWEAKSCD